MRRSGVLLAGVILAGCAGARPSPTEAPNAFGLTDWHTNLAATTCAEYTNSMTTRDQIIAAAFILANMRRNEVSDASDGREFAVQFSGDIVSACRDYYADTPKTSMIAGATMAWLNDPLLHPPHR